MADRIMTEDDYYALPDDVRAELIDGRLFYMESPGLTHQTVYGELFYQISAYIKSKNGSCWIVPDFDTKLDTAEDTIVRPDISIICDPDKLTERRCEGAPDWIIEIVSPGNPKHDYLTKLELYQRTGVREYWIVDPRKKTVTVYRLDENDFDMTCYSFQDKIKVGIYDDLMIDFAVI
ncbi:MAG: Uma2 family endonuclease [Lachnospiraceae bacterium]|nr:Uma2 family endonuclease [Lachnospiraceae bacterium]